MYWYRYAMADGQIFFSNYSFSKIGLALSAGLYGAQAREVMEQQKIQWVEVFKSDKPQQ